VYLAIQIRQNTGVVRTSSFQEIQIAFTQFSARIAESSELAGIFARGQVSFRSLPDEEKVRFSMLFSEALTLAQLGYQQHQRGLLDEALSRNMMESTIQLFRAPGVRECWESTKNWYHPEFREYLDRECVAYEPDRAPAA
jgi:hypothetical protein